MFEQKVNLDDVARFMSQLRQQQCGAYSNYYGVDGNALCEMETLPNTMLIRKREFDFYRLYVLSTDADELTHVLQTLDSDTYVLNIPSKTPITEWDELLKSCGFDFLDVYSRYYNNNIRSYPTSINTFAKENDLDDVAELLNTTFSPYTDHIPEKDELLEMIQQHRVISDYQEGRVCGVLIYTIQGKKGYQNAWVDRGENGLALLLKVKNIFIERGIKYCYYWIKDSNTPVIKIHSMLGGRPDGLKDYTYIKR